MGGVVGTKQRKTGERPSTFFGGKRLYTLERPCFIDKMERTWLCEKTPNLYKDGGECFLGKRLRYPFKSFRVLGKYDSR
ncbi:hypothetical protein T11_4584 [Trichinella zimbabwensis]|uniref:Uncharacterized protein n=1 Tax=Trichinella zimbabwensis TaxID=268475 RepID=A0A0V1GC09_9BILA|nr:hypothetical protein T11_4584 [Trichinella zimbabwensis]